MNEVVCDGTVMLTYVPGYGDKTALLTVRGKDNDISAKDLRLLAQACLRIADAVELEIDRLEAARRRLEELERGRR